MESPPNPRRGPSWLELAAGGLFLLALVGRCAVVEGASSLWMTGPLVAAGLTALAAVLLTPGRCLWLDVWRLLLVLALLVELPAVYASLGGDGYEYYAFARSPLIDHDLDFTNDFAGFGVRPPRTREGEITSRVPIGQALVWAPFVVVAHVGATVASALGARVTPDGFSPLYPAAVTGATFLLGALALALVEALIRRRIGRAGAALATLALFYATPLHFYLVANPFMSHGTQACAGALFVTLWLRARQRGDGRAWLLAGAAGALMSLVRAQDGVLLIPAFLDALLTPRGAPPADGKPLPRLTSVVRFSLFPLGAILLQTLVWRLMYGGRFVETVAWLNWVEPSTANVAGVLFSPRHGLFAWTPLFALAAAGWLLLARRALRLALWTLLGFGLAVWVNANLIDWWGSDAFGQRRLLVLLPLFALGLAESIAFVQRRPLVAVGAVFFSLAVWNVQLEWIYNAELVAPKGGAVTLDRLAPAQVQALYRSTLAARRWMPQPLWLLAYDQLSGVWLDDPPRSLGGRLDVGREPDDTSFRPFGEGWLAPEREGDTTFRRIRGRRAWLRLPLKTQEARTIVIRARAEFDPPQPLECGLRWNDYRSETQRLTREWTEVRFQVPAEAIHVGFNDVALVFSSAPRESVPSFEGRNVPASVAWVRSERR